MHPHRLQKLIIEKFEVSPTIDPEMEVFERVKFLKSYLIESGARGFVLGISGGQDSTLAGMLAKRAVWELTAAENSSLRGRQYSFVAMRLPYGTQADEQDAQDAMGWICPTDVVTVDIKPAVDAMVTAVQANNLFVTDFNKGNIKARQRMIAQYAVAAAYNLLVIGTDHAAEAVTGFYTKHGDGACDLTPLSGLNKRQGRQLLEYLGCPRHLYEKVPTADLEDGKPGLPDEVSLGLTYDQIDDYLEGKKIDEAAADKLEAQFKATMHKRRLPAEFWRL